MPIEPNEASDEAGEELQRGNEREFEE